MSVADTPKAHPIAPPGEGIIAQRVAAGLGLRPSPLDDRHLSRLAIVYIRQSDPQQVLSHIESRERQYALVDLAVALGWPRDRVLLIDEDQGNSGKTADRRTQLSGYKSNKFNWLGKAVLDFAFLTRSMPEKSGFSRKASG